MVGKNQHWGSSEGNGKEGPRELGVVEGCQRLPWGCVLSPAPHVGLCADPCTPCLVAGPWWEADVPSSSNTPLPPRQAWGVTPETAAAPPAPAPSLFASPASCAPVLTPGDFWDLLLDMLPLWVLPDLQSCVGAIAQQTNLLSSNGATTVPKHDPRAGSHHPDTGSIFPHCTPFSPHGPYPSLLPARPSLSMVHIHPHPVLQ